MSDLSKAFHKAEALYREGRLQLAESELDLLISNGLDAKALVDARLLRGVCRVKLAKTHSAIDDLGAVLEVRPDDFEALVWQCMAHKSLQDYEKAVLFGLRAVAARPDSVVAHNALGTCYLSMRRTNDAIKAFEAAVECDPMSGAAHQNLGIAFRLAERRYEALDAFRKAVELAPDNPDNFLKLSEQCQRIGLWNEAIECLEAGLARHRQHVPLMLVLAGAYGSTKNPAKAEKMFRRALAFDPSATEAYALWMQEEGRFEEAVQVLEKSLAARPNQGLAYYVLTETKQFAYEGEPLTERMLKIAQNPRLGPTDRMYLHYALGKALEHDKDYEGALRSFDQANDLAFRIYNEGRPFSHEVGRSRTDRLIELFDQAAFERVSSAGSSSHKPIFIVGMIRSGTTLLEQILSSHPRVKPAGETIFWMAESDRIYSSWSQGIRTEDFGSLERDYLFMLETIAGDAPRITDKMPLNFEHLGPIHAVFPEARILHIRRNPVDTCLSIYTTHFGNGPNFGYNQNNIAFFYTEYMRLMEHWRRTLPEDRFFELDYEDLVADRAPVIRELLDFCGLDWSDACLHHEENTSAINTPSRWQARQPMYKTSIERWRRYEPWLGGLLQLKDVRHPAPNLRRRETLE